MFAVIIVFGALIAGMGLWGFILPTSFMDYMRRVIRTSQGLYWVFGTRLLLGCLLLIAAPVSQYPTLFYVVGVLALFGALTAIMLGARNLEHYIGWWLQRPAICLRLIMLLSWLLGVLLIYVAWASMVL
ncbi:MAG: hypothetical protein R3E62_05360 [Pseudomonadales bacterium]|jgi:hypothetical protein